MLADDDLTVGSSCDYPYDDVGRLTQTTADNGGPIVVLSAAYDAAGRRTGLQATIDGAANFQTADVYDRLGRLTRVTTLCAPLRAAAVSYSERRIEQDAPRRTGRDAEATKGTKDRTAKMPGAP